MARPVSLLALGVVMALVAGTVANGQTPQRRLATIHAVRQFPAYYHLQNVLLRGEFSDDEEQLTLRADDRELRVSLEAGVPTTRGPVEVRGYIVDVGRLNPGDPRATPLRQEREATSWPRPGEDVVLRVTGVSEAQVPATPSVRALTLEPWRYAGDTITLVGNFRGRNLFGDLPGAPAKSRYDFVLRGAEGAIWVTGLRPRGRGFELDVDRRIDSDRWIEVTGTVAHDNGLVTLEGTTVTMATAPEVHAVPEEKAPEVPKLPVEVVFHSPREGETDVRPTETIRIQFARGLNEPSLADRIRVTLVGAPADSPSLAHKAVYDAGSRSVAIRFDQPLPALSTVRIEILDGVRGFDGAPVTPWAVTFSTGS